MKQETRLKLADGRDIAYHKLEANPECRHLPGLVFLCGFKSAMEGDKARFLHQWAEERGLAYVRFDYTGHGASSGRFEDGTIGAWSRDAGDVLSRLTEGRQILIGSSMGGWIACLLALRFPERVAGLIGLAAAPDFTAGGLDHRLTKEERETMRREGRVAVPSAYSEEPYVYTRALVEDGNRHLVLTGAVPIAGPVRLLHGTADPDVDPAVGRDLLARVESPDATLTLIRGGDHRLSDPRSLRHLTRALEDVLEGCGLP